MIPGLALAEKAGEALLEAGKAFIRRKWPDPEEQARREREFEEVAANLDAAALAGFRDFVVQYEGAAADVHPFLQIYRGIVRPTITFYLIGLLTWAIATVQPLEVIQFIFTLNLLSLGFWFGERALSKLGINADTIKGVLNNRRSDPA